MTRSWVVALLICASVWMASRLALESVHQHRIDRCMSQGKAAMTTHGITVVCLSVIRKEP